MYVCVWKNLRTKWYSQVFIRQHMCDGPDSAGHIAQFHVHCWVSEGVPLPHEAVTDLLIVRWFYHVAKWYLSMGKRRYSLQIIKKIISLFYDVQNHSFLYVFSHKLTWALMKHQRIGEPLGLVVSYGKEPARNSIVTLLKIFGFIIVILIKRFRCHFIFNTKGSRLPSDRLKLYF